MAEEAKTKRSFGKKFVSFLMHGGFLLILVLGVVLFIVIDSLLLG